MLYNIKQAGGLKASSRHVRVGLALCSLFNYQQSTSKAPKQLTGILLIDQKLFRKPSANSTTSLGLLSTN